MRYLLWLLPFFAFAKDPMNLMLKFELLNSQQIFQRLKQLPKPLTPGNQLQCIERWKNEFACVLYSEKSKWLEMIGSDPFHLELASNVDALFVKDALYLYNFKSKQICVFKKNKVWFLSTIQPIDSEALLHYFQKKLHLSKLKKNEQNAIFIPSRKKHKREVYTYSGSEDLCAIYALLQEGFTLSITLSEWKLKQHTNHFYHIYENAEDSYFQWIYPNLHPLNKLATLKQHAISLTTMMNVSNHLLQPPTPARKISMQTTVKAPIKQCVAKIQKKGTITSQNKTGLSHIYFLKAEKNIPEMIFKPFAQDQYLQSFINMKAIEMISSLSGLDVIAPSIPGWMRDVKIKQKDLQPKSLVFGIYQKFYHQLDLEKVKEKIQPLSIWKAVLMILLCDLQDLHDNNILVYQNNETKILILDTDEYCLDWSLPAYHHRFRFERKKTTQTRGIFDFYQEKIPLKTLATLAQIVSNWDIERMEHALTSFRQIDPTTREPSFIFNEKRRQNFVRVARRIKNYVICCNQKKKQFRPLEFAYFIRPDLNPGQPQKDLEFEQIFNTPAIEE